MGKHVSRDGHGWSLCIVVAHGFGTWIRKSERSLRPCDLQHVKRVNHTSTEKRRYFLFSFEVMRRLTMMRRVDALSF